MSLTRYTEYKDSGVERLGDVPAHWSVAKLKHVVGRIESGVSVNSTDEPAVEGALGVLKTSCVYSGTFDVNQNKTVVPEEIGRVACPVLAGALIVSRMNTPGLVGAAGLTYEAVPNIFLPDRLWQVTLRNACPKFVHYWTSAKHYRAQVQLVCAGTSSSMQNLSQPDFLGFVLALPDASEQRLIVSFLDRETARIDALIADQETLLALLAEKRQATISHAVTRGLDPNVPMKDSGIAWLGDVPTHWRVDRFKASVAFAKNGVWGAEPCGDEADMPCVRVADFDRRALAVRGDIPTIRNVAESERVGRVLQRGDLLLEKSGGGENQPVGQVVLYDREEPAVCSNFVARVRLREGMESRFWRYLHAAAYAVRINTRAVKQTSGIQNLDQDQYFSEHAVFPPHPEQCAISDFLDQAAAEFDLLEGEVTGAISLLKERRSALISAAVTGQIDVRGLVGEETA